jgi:hypothetical protein
MKHNIILQNIGSLLIAYSCIYILTMITEHVITITKQNTIALVYFSNVLIMFIGFVSIIIASINKQK